MKHDVSVVGLTILEGSNVLELISSLLICSHDNSRSSVALIRLVLRLDVLPGFAQTSVVFPTFHHD